MAMVLLPEGAVLDEKECPFCKETYFAVNIRGRICGFDKVEGVADAYRPHECDEMMEALERLLIITCGGKR